LLRESPSMIFLLFSLQVSYSTAIFEFLPTYIIMRIGSLIAAEMPNYVERQESACSQQHTAIIGTRINIILYNNNDMTCVL
jgi:hypothetical protein